MGTVVRQTLPVVDAIQVEIARRGVSLRTAAMQLGVSHQTVTNWLRGGTTPVLTSEAQHNIAAFLGVSPKRVVELFDLDLSSEASEHLAGHADPAQTVIYTATSPARLRAAVAALDYAPPSTSTPA